jgi:PAS domain S-box-containing protein
MDKRELDPLDAVAAGPRRSAAGEAPPASGVPADGRFEVGDSEPLGRAGLRHWQQSTISRPGLEDRGDIFFAAVEMTRMPMVLSDPNLPDHPLVFVNNAFLDLTGYEEAEVLGRNCRFLQGAQTDREVVRQLREAVEARQAIAVEILNYRRDGSPFWNAVFMGPVYGPKGELIYFFASQLDVSRRRESEQALRQAQKMESIGQLTAGVAHDFNNLLQVLTTSLARLTERGSDEAARRRYLAAAANAADRGVKLTRQLLAFARRSRLEPRTVDLSALVASISELLETTAGARARLRLDLAEALPAITVDPVHLEMALINIVLNARDAMPEGGDLRVETRLRPAGGGAGGREVLLSVGDSGLGMAPGVKARATEPFFTTKRPGEGTGLGLAMVHGFVQQSGGRLEIESELGRGALITLSFPAAEAVRAPPRPTRRPPAPAPAADVTRPLVLVVDDNAEIAALAEETLLDAGYEVETFSSGEAALAGFARQDRRVALVFSDVVMPGGMNGLDLADELRRRDPALPVLLTTGYNDEMALEGPRPRAMDVIGKPYSPAELLDRVREAIRIPPLTARRTPSDFGPARM